MSEENTASTTNDGDSRFAVTIILGISAAVVAFLIWIIYFHEPGDLPPPWVKTLPVVNASLNALSAILVVVGLVFIKRGLRKQHAVMMILATLSSGAFLVFYLLHKSYVGDTKFTGEDWFRPIYFFILFSHVVLSVVVVPMIFSSLFFASTRKFLSHKKVAKWTYPVWFYVSVTGVLVFAILKASNSYQ
ncbi:MAG: DUF420 domain-containing protein [Opitutales bacterium]